MGYPFEAECVSEGECRFDVVWIKDPIVFSWKTSKSSRLPSLRPNQTIGSAQACDPLQMK